MEWNLKDLYNDISSKKIGSDYKKLLSLSIEFNKKYKRKINKNSSPKIILKSLQELESIYEGIGKISSYSSLLFAANTDSEEVSKFYQLTSERSSEIRKNLIFYFLDWNKIDSASAKKIYSSGSLSIYFLYFLSDLRR